MNQRFRINGRKPRAARVAAGVAAASTAAVLLAACSSSSSGGASGGTSGGAGTSTSGASSNADISALSSAVKQAEAEPSFSQYAAGYGGKVPSIANLRGKKIMIVPGNSALAACTEIAQADAAIATEAGMKPTIFANQGTVGEHTSAVENAIHQGYAAINLECDFDPTTIAPAIAQAQKAGIAVAVYGATPEEAAASKVTYNTVDPYELDGKLAADQAVVDAQGKPFDAIAITSNAAPATALLNGSMKTELKKVCPDCTVTDVNVEVPNWQKDIANSLSSALLQHPNASVVFPDYAGMLTYVLTGIQSAHKSASVKTYLAFGGGTPFIKLQTAQPGSSVIQGDVGGYPPWTGYLLFLQTVRALEKLPPIPYEKAIGPNRNATPQNAVDVLTTGGWGTSWVNGFRDLLGLPALSGSQLTAAATLNGVMVDKP